MSQGLKGLKKGEGIGKKAASEAKGDHTSDEKKTGGKGKNSNWPK
jgi:hypothetical protein